jgi:hypothetical protein
VLERIRAVAAGASQAGQALFERIVALVSSGVPLVVSIDVLDDVVEEVA